MHIPSLAKTDWYLFKLFFRNENTGMSQADNSLKNWRNLPISNPKLRGNNLRHSTDIGTILTAAIFEMQSKFFRS